MYRNHRIKITKLNLEEWGKYNGATIQYRSSSKNKSMIDNHTITSFLSQDEQQYFEFQAVDHPENQLKEFDVVEHLQRQRLNLQ